jgi:hypothetical protein
VAGVVTSPEPGPLAEEAARLVGAAQDWLHRVVGEPDTPRMATGAPECCWCPLCQLIATLRGERPDLVERLADGQAALAGTFRALADALGRGAPGSRGPTGPSAASEPSAGSEPSAASEPSAGSEPSARARVQHIELDADAAEPPRPS